MIFVDLAATVLRSLCSTFSLVFFRVICAVLPASKQLSPRADPKTSDSGVRSETFFSFGVRSELDRFDRSENPEPPNPEKIDR